MRTSSPDRSGRFGAVVLASAGAVIGAVLGVGIGAGGALLSRAIGSDPSGWEELGIVAFAVVLLAPVLAVAGALVALRLRYGRALPRPVPLSTALVLAGATGGALLGSGVFRWTLAGLGVAVGIVIAAGFDGAGERT